MFASTALCDVAAGGVAPCIGGRRPADPGILLGRPQAVRLPGEAGCYRVPVLASGQWEDDLQALLIVRRGNDEGRVEQAFLDLRADETSTWNRHQVLLRAGERRVRSEDEDAAVGHRQVHGGRRRITAIPPPLVIAEALSDKCPVFTDQARVHQRVAARRRREGWCEGQGGGAYNCLGGSGVLLASGCTLVSVRSIESGA